MITSRHQSTIIIRHIILRAEIARLATVAAVAAVQAGILRRGGGEAGVAAAGTGHAVDLEAMIRPTTTTDDAKRSISTDIAETVHVGNEVEAMTKRIRNGRKSTTAIIVAGESILMEMMATTTRVMTIMSIGIIVDMVKDQGPGQGDQNANFSKTIYCLMEIDYDHKQISLCHRGTRSRGVWGGR